MLGAAAHRRRADSMTACSLAARLICRLQMPSRFNSVRIQSLHAISGENGILPQHGDGGCKLGCGGAGDGRVVGHGFKTRSLPTVSLHPGVLPSSPFLHAYMPACSINACACARMSTCIGRSIYLCMCARTCIYTHVSACICLHIYIFVCLCISMRIHTCICMHVCTYIYMQLPVNIHTYMHVDVCADVCLQMCICVCV